MLVSKNLV